jgi:hypothetical protein
VSFFTKGDGGNEGAGALGFGYSFCNYSAFDLRVDGWNILRSLRLLL